MRTCVPRTNPEIRSPLLEGELLPTCLHPCPIFVRRAEAGGQTLKPLGTMAEALFVFSKALNAFERPFLDPFLVKPPKKSFFAPRMVVLVLATACGLYITLTCLKQIKMASHTDDSEIPLVKQPCDLSGISPEEARYVHFPKPVTYSRNECSCSPVRFFAILSMQRSGSGWFETLLNSHINISSNGEVFSVKDRRSNISVVVETLDRVYNLDWYSSASKNECSAAVGFKWMLNQGVMDYHKEIVEYFSQRGVSTIFLFRRNLLRRMISELANSFDRNKRLLNGTHKSHVHSLAEADILATYRPRINTSLMLTDFKRVENWTAMALEHFKETRHIVYYYEDLVSNHTKLIDIQDFLRLPRRNLRSSQVKIHRKSLSDQVENWEDVYKTLCRTQYESFLHADYPI